MSERTIAIVDSSAIYASLDAKDIDHRRCLSALRTPGRHLVIPTLVLCEVLYLVGRRLGPETESMFLASLADIDIQPPLPDDWDRIGKLVEIYREFPLGGVDASVIALAERLNTDLIVTLDRRHFSVVRPRHAPAFRILPE